MAVKPPRGIQSATVGLRVLRVLADSAGPLQLREIAGHAGMDTSNVYRYLVSFVEAGLVVQRSDSRYDLGPFAIELGLAALRRLDGLDLAIKALGDLVATVDLDGHVSVFGSHGATVVRWRGRVNDVVVRVSEGTVLPPLSSATARAWGAFLEPARFEPILAADLARSARRATERKQLRLAYERKLAAVRRTGLSLSLGERRLGLDALSSPVFDRDGSVAFVLTLMGPPQTFAADLSGLPADALRRAAADLTRALGADARALARYPWLAADAGSGQDEGRGCAER